MTIKRALLSGLLLIGLFFVCKPVIAYAESIKNFTATYVVQQDSSVQVTERIVYDFGTEDRHGIFRDIPLVNNENKQIHIDDVSVTDESGGTYNAQIDTKNGSLDIKIGDANSMVTGVHTYVLRYSVRGAITYYDDHDELYWNVTGTDWQVPIMHASASVQLPEGSSVTKTACFVGIYQSTTPCTLSKETFTTPHSLDKHEGLSIVVGFPKGVVAVYDTASYQVNHTIKTIFTVLPFALFGLYIFIAYIRWSKYGKDPKGAGVIIPQYDAPDGLTPSEVGLINTPKFDTKFISAEIIYLATKGYIHIAQTGEKKILGFSSRNYVLSVTKIPDASLTTFDQKLLGSLFGTATIGTSIALSSLQNSFFTKMLSLKKTLSTTLVEKGYYTNLSDSSVSTIAGVIGIVVGFGISGFVGTIILQSLHQLFISFIGGLVTMIVWIIFSSHMSARSQKGITAYEYARGFKEYLQIAEKDRINFHNAPEKNPETFEAFLPYAMVFGVEKAWAKEFADIYTIPPTWYSGEYTTFNALYLVQEMNRFSSASAVAIGGARPSGGSGFSGGFSGGGGGGGGGGSW